MQNDTKTKSIHLELIRAREIHFFYKTIYIFINCVHIHDIVFLN